MRILLTILLSLASCAMNLPARTFSFADRHAQAEQTELCERSQPVICPLLRTAELARWSIQPSTAPVAVAIDRSWNTFLDHSNLPVRFGFLFPGTLQSLDVRLQV